MSQRNLKVIYRIEGYTLDGTLVMRRYAHDIKTARKIAKNITGAVIKKMPKYSWQFINFDDVE